MLSVQWNISRDVSLLLFSSGQNPNYKSIAEHCNLWRNYDDIYDSWDSVLGIINFYGDDKVGKRLKKKSATFFFLQDGFGKFAGPGHWNDPDMLIIGNYGLSLDQVSFISSEFELVVLGTMQIRFVNH